MDDRTFEKAHGTECVVGEHATSLLRDVYEDRE